MNRIFSCLFGAALAVAVITLPLALDTMGFTTTASAFAKGGHGAANGHGGGSSGHGNGIGNAYGLGKQAQAADDSEPASDNLGNSHGKISSALGRLNAARASATARAHAAPNSAVGLVAAYENAAQVSAAVATLNDPNATQKEIDAAKATLAQLGMDPENPPTPEEAATAEVEALAAAANKSIAPMNANDDQDGNNVSDAIQGEVNSLLGIADNQ